MRLKGFASPAFLSGFDRLQRAGEPVAGRKRWTAHGLTWVRSRHTYYGDDYGLSVDVVRATAAGPKPWTLMVVREGWWAEGRSDLIKTRQWAHLVKGDRAQALADFERLIEALR